MVNNIKDLHEALRQLSSVGREIIAEWLRDFMIKEDYRAASGGPNDPVIHSLNGLRRF